MEEVRIPKEDWNEFKTNQKELTKAVVAIQTALAGDDELKTEGIIQRVSHLERKQQETEALKNKGIGIFIAFTFIGSAICTAIIEGIKYWIHH